MATTFVEEFERSWLTSLIGVLVFCGGFYLLTWNEGRAVHHHHSLEETYNSAISLNPFEQLNPDYDGRVVHITGNLAVDEPLTEPEYGISIQSVKLKRRVQMYQWIEERSPRSDDNDDIIQQRTDTDYYYVTEWRDKLVDSSSFYIRRGHENPTDIPLKTVIYTAPDVKIGPLTLGQELKVKFSDFYEVTSDERPDRKDIKLHLGIYYHCQDVFNPEVGDIRVQFYYAGLADEPVTIVAKQEKGVLVPYTTSKDKQIALLRFGNLDISEMFSAEHWDARAETWKLRYCFPCLHFGGDKALAEIGSPHVVMTLFANRKEFNQLPYLADVISGDATDAKNFLVAGSVALFIIAFAWIFYRPMIGASLIFAAISPFLYCIMGVYGAAQNGFVARS